MRIASGGAYIPRLSANQLIGSASRTRAAVQPGRVNAIDSREGIEELEALGPKSKAPNVSRINLGPSVADLTPQPNSQRPQGFFANELPGNTTKEASPQADSSQGAIIQESDVPASQSGEQAAKNDELQQNTEGANQNAENLSEEEQQEVNELKSRDAEVVAHEQAHKAVAGALSPGPIHYDYTRGPDQVNYRSGGHVNINTSEGRTPEETLSKAAIIQRAALAPAEPSGQDRAVAAEAAQMAAKARQEISEKRSESINQQSKEADNSKATPKIGQNDQDQSDADPINSESGITKQNAKSSEESSTAPEFKVPEFQMRKALSSYAAMASSSLMASQFGSIRA